MVKIGELQFSNSGLLRLSGLFVYMYLFWAKISLATLAFWNGLDDSKANWHIEQHCSNDPSMSQSGINLVGICAVTPELMRLNCVQQASMSNYIH